MASASNDRWSFSLRRERKMIASISTADSPGKITRTIGPTEIGQQVAEFIERSRILTRPIDRIAFASDASLYRLIPRAVVQPVNSEEVRRLFQYSRERNISLTFRAGG